MTKLLVIGFAGLDWARFEGRLRSGETPTFSMMSRRGVSGWLAGAPVTDGPAAWATLATGVQPEVHRVWKAQEPWSGGLRRTTRASWRAAPVWERLQAAEIDCAVVGWPATRKGADWRATVVDDSFAEATGSEAADWSLPLDCAPARWREPLRDLRVHPADITPQMLAPFETALRQADPSVRDRAFDLLAAALAQAGTIQKAALHLLPGAGAAFVHHPILHQLRLAFPANGPITHAGLAPAALRFVDALTAALVGAAGPQTTVVTVSPGLRGAGFLAATGPAPARGVRFEGASVLDLAPTVLAAFGLAAPDLPGRPLGMFAAETAAVAPIAEISQAPAADDALVSQARASGCAPPPTIAPQWLAAALAELGTMVLNRDPDAALQIAAEATAADPGSIPALQLRARALAMLGRANDLLQAADDLDVAGAPAESVALARGAHHVLRKDFRSAAEWLSRAGTSDDPPTLVAVAVMWLAAGSPSHAERVFQRLLILDPLNVSAEMGLAMAAMGRREFLVAEQRLVRALRQDPGRPGVYVMLTQIYARTHRHAEAARTADAAVRVGVRPEILEAFLPPSGGTC